MDSLLILVGSLFARRFDEITLKDWTFGQSDPVGQHNRNPLPRRVVIKRLAVVHFLRFNRCSSRPARVCQSSRKREPRMPDSCR